MSERKWRLGDDLITSDSLLDGITFDDVILQVHCNCRSITLQAVLREINDLVEQRLDDMRELLTRNIDIIMAEAGKGH